MDRNLLSASLLITLGFSVACGGGDSPTGGPGLPGGGAGLPGGPGLPGGGAPADPCATPLTAPPPYRGDPEHAFLTGCMTVSPEAAATARVPGEILPGRKALSVELAGNTIDDICQLEYLCDDKMNPLTCVLDEIEVDTDLFYDGQLHGGQVEVKHTDFTIHQAQLPMTYMVAPDGPGAFASPNLVSLDGELKNGFRGALNFHTVFEEKAMSGIVTLHMFTGMKDPKGIVREGPDVWVGFNFLVQFPGGTGDWLAGSLSSPCTRIPSCKNRNRLGPNDRSIDCPF